MLTLQEINKTYFTHKYPTTITSNRYIYYHNIQFHIRQTGYMITFEQDVLSSQSSVDELLKQYGNNFEIHYSKGHHKSIWDTSQLHKAKRNYNSENSYLSIKKLSLEDAVTLFDYLVIESKKGKSL